MALFVKKILLTGITKDEHKLDIIQTYSIPIFTEKYIFNLIVNIILFKIKMLNEFFISIVIFFWNKTE